VSVRRGHSRSVTRKLVDMAWPLGNTVFYVNDGHTHLEQANIKRFSLKQLLCCWLYILLIGIQGCRGSSSGEPNTVNLTANNAVRFAIEDDPRSLEPGLSVLMQDSVLALDLHVGLFRYDAASVLNPYLVNSWQLSNDHRTFTFVLHDDWKWHNGRIITAYDVKKGWERYLNPRVGAWGATYIGTISGAQEMIHGVATSLRGVEVVDSHTLKVTLAHPDPLFLLRLGAPPAWTVPPEAVVDGEPAWKGDPVGAGPFQFVLWQPHSRIVLKANPHFAGDASSLNRLEFMIVPDLTTMLNMYRDGELDIAQVGVHELREVKQDEQLSEDIHSWPTAQLQFVGLNENRVAAFRDGRVRQALVLAVDRRSICERVLDGAWTPASEIVPEGVPGHLGENILAFDPARARKLLADAGFPNARGFPVISLVVAGTTESTAAEAMAAQLADNLGIKMEVRRVEPGEFLAGLKQQRWDAFLTGWTADYLSAEQWLCRLLSSNGSTNYVGYRNARYEKILDDAMRAPTAEEQLPLWREANRMATADAALIPLGYGRFTYLVRPTISGFACNLFGPVGFEKVRKSVVRK